MTIEKICEVYGITPGPWGIEEDNVPEEYRGLEGITVRAKSGFEYYIATICDTDNIVADANAIAYIPSLLLTLWETWEDLTETLESLKDLCSYRELGWLGGIIRKVQSQLLTLYESCKGEKVSWEELKRRMGE